MSLHRQAFALTIMHVVDVLQPLLVIPYAARVLGPEQFGRFVYALSVGAVAATLVDYGFHWTGQRESATARGDESALSQILANITCAKGALLLVVLVIGLSCSHLLGLDRSLFLAALVTAAGNVLFPAWLFIGTEQCWRAALPATVARFILLGAFLEFVQTPQDVAIATAIQGAAPLLAAAMTAGYTMKLAVVGLRRVSASSIVNQFKDGSRAFLFTLVERTVITAPILMVTYLQGYSAAGNYSIADKFIGASRPFFRVISETFLPRVAYYAKHAPDHGISLVWNVCYTLVVGATFSLILYFVAPYMIVLLFGREFSSAIAIVKLMSIIPFLLNATLLTSTLYMFNFGHERAWGYLVALSLLVFFVVTGAAVAAGMEPIYAIPLALIAKELLVLVVSGTYFVRHVFALARAPANSFDLEQVPQTRPNPNAG